MSALLLMLLLLGAEPACRSDDDCVLVTECSCDCCPSPLRSVRKSEAERVTSRCTSLECPIRSCAEVECQNPDQTLMAACQRGRCVAVKKPLPAEGCVTDADCTMARDCGCGCCPSPTVPMTKKAALEVRQKCARLGPCGRDPEQCAGETCVPDVPGSAVCQANVCVRAPPQRPVLDAGVR